MAVKLSRRGIVLLSVLVLLIVGGATGYIIWRTYQENTVSPTDSDAGGDPPAGCPADADLCDGTLGCEESGNETEDWCEDGGAGDLCGNVVCPGYGRCHCCDGNWLIGELPCSDVCENNGGYGSCEPGGGGDNNFCECESYENGCGVNCVFPTGTGQDVQEAADAACGKYIAMCRIEGTQTVISIEEFGPGHVCWGKEDECNNPVRDGDCGICGDGVVDEGEQCDDGNTNDNDSCTNECTFNNTPPACTGLIMKQNGSTVNDATVQASDALQFTLTGTDPDGNPSDMMVCFALDNQADSFYSAASGANWYCLAKGSAGTSYTVNTTFETIKNAYLAEVPSVTEAQIIENGFTVATNIFDNDTTATNFCTSNPAYTTAVQAVLYPIISTDPTKTCSAIGVGCNNTLNVAAPPPLCGDGNIDPGEQCDPPGEPTDACTYGDCSLDCQCPAVDAGFEVAKTGAGICVEGTETYSDVTYTVTIQNNGSTIAHVSQVIDTLDPDIEDEWILESTIDPSTNVTVAAGTITWDLTGDEQIFDPGEDMEFTYTIRVPEASFGTYENSVEVVVTDEGAENVTDTYTIDVSCDETPETGIFDSVAGRITVAILLIIASAAYLYSDGTDRLMLKLAGTSGRLNRARDKFEKKTAK